MTPSHKKLAAVALVLVAVTWWAATAPDSPIRPEPPRPERPVLRFLGRVAAVAAKLGLTALVFMEPTPTDADEVQIVSTGIGADGYQMLDNSRW